MFLILNLEKASGLRHDIVMEVIILIFAYLLHIALWCHKISPDHLVDFGY